MALLLERSALETGLQQGDFETIVRFMERNLSKHSFNFLPGLQPEELDMASCIVESGHKAHERQGPFVIDPYSQRVLMVNGLRIAKKAEQVSRLSPEFRPLVPPRIAGDPVAISEYSDSVIDAERSFSASRLFIADLANDALRDLYPTNHPGTSVQEQGAAANYWSLGILMGFVALERAQVEELAL